MVSYVASKFGLKPSELRLLICLFAAISLIAIHNLSQTTRSAVASVIDSVQTVHLLSEIPQDISYEIVLDHDFGTSSHWYPLDSSQRSNWHIVNGTLRMLPVNDGSDNFAVAVTPVTLARSGTITISADLKHAAGDKIEIGFSLLSDDGTVLKTDKRCPSTIDGEYVVTFDLMDIDFANDSSGMLAIQSYNWSEVGVPALIEIDNVQVSANF